MLKTGGVHTCQSMVPPQSASIRMNSCATCASLMPSPKYGPSRSKNSRGASSPLPSASASCAQRASGGGILRQGHF